MGSQEVMERLSSVENGVNLCNGGVVQHSDNVGESENLGVELLNDLDSYLEDIDDRLTISRMVNDSVIKGMVYAVEQEAAQKIAKQELELAKLMGALHRYHTGADDNESLAYPSMCHERRTGKCSHCFIFSSDALHELKNDSLGNLNILAREQFKKLEEEIKRIKGSTLISRKTSISELLGLSGIPEENEPDKWTDAERILEGLRSMLDSVCEHTEDVVLLSKSSLFEWQQERQFLEEIEGMVMKKCICGVQDEYERRLWAHNTQHEYRNANCLERIKEISSLRQELDSISESLSNPENGQLFSHGFLGHQKASGNHISSITLPWEGNGNHDLSIITIPENLDLHQLSHLNKEGLMKYFKAEMTKMKRDHELKVQEMTEQYFSLKREHLKERQSSLPGRIDKEFELLKKKIPVVIQKLDDFLVESEKWPTFSQNSVSFDHTSSRLNSLLSENCQLRESLADKKREIMCLSSQVSDATDKLSQHFLAESKLLRMVRNFKREKQDVCAETLISEDLFKFLVKEAISQMKCLRQESAFENVVVQGLYEVILKEAAAKSQSTSCVETRDSDMESMITQGLSEVIFREAFKDAEEKLNKLLLHHESLEMKVLEKERALTSTTQEREKMEQEKQEAKDALGKEKVKFEAASQQLKKLRIQTSQQQIILSESGEEVQAIKSKLVEALEKIELYRGETCQLRERLDSITKELQETAKEKIKLLVENQEKNNFLSMCEVREREHRKQLDSLVVVVSNISRVITDFECLAAESIERNNQSVENLGSQLSCLIWEAKNLRKLGSMYKQRLERRSSDLQKAEAEVDLLGDKVDALLSLLEKIYIALDHYSPILQHYPGIIEILKLVRRELSGEAIKPV